MQTLDVISINIWQILISLLNLLLLFLILKHFLYRPVKKMLEQRRKTMDAAYEAADAAKTEADALKKEWKSRMRGADAEAKAIKEKAEKRAAEDRESILNETREKADQMVRQAKADAAFAYKKAEEQMKQEIIDVSAKISEKIIGREINTEDHHAIINSFLDEIGEDHDGKQ